MLNRLIAFFSGYLLLSLSGSKRIQFINECSRRNIPLWSVRKTDRDLTLCTSIKGFMAMRKPARAYRCNVRVLGRRGIPFFGQRLKRRASFSLGASLFVILIYVLSGFVWFVEVEGSQRLTATDIAPTLKKQGLFVGAWRHSVDQDRVASTLLKDFPQLAWAGVRIKGSRAHIQLVDKEVVNPTIRVPGDIVASKEGLLTRIIATSGQAIVTPGTTVSAGQTLITGSVVVEGQVAALVEAAGIVEARVWYEAYGSASVKRIIQIPSGEEANSEYLRVMGSALHLSGPDSAPYQLFEVETLKRILLPGVEHITVIYREMLLVEEVVTKEQARSEAMRLAEANLQGRLPATAKTVDQKKSEEWSKDGNTIFIRLLVETLEDIGRFVAYRAQ